MVWAWKALANLVYYLDCKNHSREGGRGFGKGFWVGVIFDLAGLSNDHLLSPSLLYNYGHQQTVLPSFISTLCGIALLQLCNMVGLGQTVMISGKTRIGKGISVSLISLSVL